jgi:hypothetical protein
LSVDRKYTKLLQFGVAFLLILELNHDLLSEMPKQKNAKIIPDFGVFVLVFWLKL